MQPDYVRVIDGDAAALAEFLTGDTWPFHAGPPVDRETVLRRAADGHYAHTFWAVVDGVRAGLVRLDDLDDDTPIFDLRLATAYRGHGIGRHAVGWLTRHLFTAADLPHVNRIEATTRQDNHAMRATLLRCGYVKEAHYRDGWPSADGTMHDAVGYATLRRDWLTGTVTPVPWGS